MCLTVMIANVMARASVVVGVPLSTQQINTTFCGKVISTMPACHVCAFCFNLPFIRFHYHKASPLRKLKFKKVLLQIALKLFQTVPKE